MQGDTKLRAGHQREGVMKAFRWQPDNQSQGIPWSSEPDRILDNKVLAAEMGALAPSRAGGARPGAGRGPASTGCPQQGRGGRKPSRTDLTHERQSFGFEFVAVLRKL